MMSCLFIVSSRFAVRTVPLAEEAIEAETGKTVWHRW